jgi:hypothetical protein
VNNTENKKLTESWKQGNYCLINMGLIFFYKINVQVKYRFLIKNKKSVHPYITILNVFTVYVAVLPFSLCPKLKELHML